MSVVCVCIGKSLPHSGAAAAPAAAAPRRSAATVNTSMAGDGDKPLAETKSYMGIPEAQFVVRRPEPLIWRVLGGWAEAGG